MFRLGLGAKIGLIAGLIGGGLGLLAAVAVAPVTGGLMALIFIAVFGSVFFFFLKPLFRANAILKTGEPATAFIKSVRDTGVTINQAPQVELLLEVRTKFKPPYEAKVKTLVSRIQPNFYQPGMTVAVKYDPKDPTAVAIDPEGGVSEAAGASGAAGLLGGKNEAQAMQEAMEFEAANRKLMASGESAMAKIVQATPLGFQVNGNNPAMELLVEVEPTGKPKFLSRAKGVISEASIPKYQPGRAIYVKYDPADTTLVTIERSA
jgi:uncharacterized protein DUF3592